MQVAAIDAEGKIVYSPVYAWGHQDPHATQEFVRLTPASDGYHTLELSPGHFIPTGAAMFLPS